MHLLRLQHRVQADRIVGYALDTYGSDAAGSAATHAVGVLCDFYAYSHGLADVDSRLLLHYVRSLIQDRVSGGDGDE